MTGGKTGKTKDPPKCDFIIQSYDTAFLKKESADYSAITTWGIFQINEDRGQYNILNAFKDRYEFPELKKVAHEEYYTGVLTW